MHRIPTPNRLLVLAARVLALACAALVLSGPAGAGAQDVNPLLDVTPPAPVGTVLMLHQGGWSGPDRAKQEQLMTFPGAVFLDRRWRIASVDYAAGKAGLQSVLDAIGHELVAPASAGPLCLYGESAGAHLALLAAARLPSVDCVIAFGAPTDFAAYAEAVGDNPIAAANYEQLVLGTFGAPGDGTADWEPAKVAQQINADVLMVRQDDDVVVPANQVERLAEALPVVRTLITPAGDASDPSQRYMHGTLSEAARAQLAGAIGSFADRAVKLADVATWARAQHCPQVNTAYGRLRPASFTGAVACLLSRARADAGSAAVRGVSRLRARRRLQVRVVGQVTAARLVRAVLDDVTARGIATRRRASRVAVKVSEGQRSTAVISLA